MTARRELAASVGLTAAGGALLALAASRPLPEVQPVVPGTSPGTLGGPGATAVGVLGLAAAVAILAVRGWLRVAVGVVVVALAVAVGVAQLVGDGETGGGEPATGTDPSVVTGDVGAVWHWLLGAGVVLLVLGGALAVTRGRRWPGMSARYERGEGSSSAGSPTGSPGSAGSEAATGSTTPAGRRTDDPRSVWDALDRGDDPTEDPTDDPPQRGS